MNANLWSGAYYLGGYAVECGLKACVLAYIEATGAIFQDRKFSERCWTHEVEELVKLAGLERDRGHAVSANPGLGVNWAIVKDWNEGARYLKWTELQARKLFEAVADPANGVLAWIRIRW
ncbi:MAG TPA: hypothetical protein VML55_05270 [Planctomycetaceae bacterium]|nr:hypothetical protein [Planctomycetaceae bacterium]